MPSPFDPPPPTPEELSPSGRKNRKRIFLPDPEGKEPAKAKRLKSPLPGMLDRDEFIELLGVYGELGDWMSAALCRERIANLIGGALTIMDRPRHEVGREDLRRAVGYLGEALLILEEEADLPPKPEPPTRVFLAEPRSYHKHLELKPPVTRVETDTGEGSV